MGFTTVYPIGAKYETEVVDFRTKQVPRLLDRQEYLSGAETSPRSNANTSPATKMAILLTMTFEPKSGTSARVYPGRFDSSEINSDATVHPLGEFVICFIYCHRNQ